MSACVRADVGVLGDAEVGKTALLAAFEQKNYFQRDYRMTQGAQAFVQGVDVTSRGRQQPQHVELLLLEVGGHELFRQSRNKYLRDIPYVLACFDLSRRASLQSVCSAFSSYKAAMTGCSFAGGLLVGCKADRRAEAEVADEEARERGRQLGLEYLESSAASGEGVEAVFLRIAELVLAQQTGSAGTGEEGTELAGDAEAASE